MSIDCARTLMNVLFARAQKCEWSWTESPGEMRQIDFQRSESTQVVKEASDVSANAVSLPFAMTAFVDVASVLVGTLGERATASREEISANLRAYHLQMAKARTWLDAGRRENMYLLLVAPPEAVLERRWLDLAYEIERNERICRKLVWLPKGHEETWISGAEFFCDRVFAEPFCGKVVSAAQELDPLGKIFAEGEFPAAWLNILVNSPDGGEALVKKLIDSMREEDV